MATPFTYLAFFLWLCFPPSEVLAEPLTPKLASLPERWPACFRPSEESKIAGEDDVASIRSSDHQRRAVTTISFLIGQNEGVNYIAERFPSLRNKVLKANLDFDARFGGSSRELIKIVQRDWPKGIEEIDRQVAAVIKPNIDDAYSSEDAATRFCEELAERAKGDLPVVVFDTLSEYDPEFVRWPELEIVRGHKKTFESDSGEKVKGLRLAIDYPSSWQTNESNRPLTVVTLSNRRLTNEVVVLQVTDLPEINGIEGIDLEKAFLEGIADGLSFQRSSISPVMHASCRVSILGGRIALWHDISQSSSTPHGDIAMRQIMFSTIYDRKLVQVIFGVGVMKGQMSQEDVANELRRLMLKYGPLFGQMMTSFDIRNRWPSKQR